MSHVVCPECSHQVSQSATACPQCGYPLSPSGDPYRPPQQLATQIEQGQRRPYFQYGLVLGAFPMAMVGITEVLQSRGWRFSQEVLGMGIGICMVPAAGLLAYSMLDRLFINRGKPVARLRPGAGRLLALLLAAIVWLGVAAAIGQ